MGHIQRGGHPTAIDRILATRLGNYAVDVLRSGYTDRCVCVKNDRLVTVPLSVAIRPKKINISETYQLVKLLTK